MTTGRCPGWSVREPVLVGQGLLELTECRVEVARLPSLEGFDEEGARKRPAGQSCDFRRELVINHSEGLLDGFHPEACSRRVQMDFRR